MQENSIPVVDLELYTKGTSKERERFTTVLGDSLRDIGFFALKNHGIKQTLIENCYKAAQDFFELDEADKRRFEVEGLKGQRGYTSFGKEHAKDSKAPDLKEFWHVGREITKDSELAKQYPLNVWPTVEVPAFKENMLSLYNQLENCALTLLESCSQYIHEDKKYLSDMAKNGNSILRVIHYPPIPANRDPQSVRAGAHEDINLITLLPEATDDGLELLQRDGSWLPIRAVPGQIIVDSGDMIQRLSNGYLKSTTHRVVNPDNSRTRRFSMPFFVHPRSEVSLAARPYCIEKTGGKKIFSDMTSGEYLEERLREIGLA